MSPSYGQRPTATAFIGLTGGIAAGKSEALRALRRLGAATLSTDEVVHELLAEDELRDQVVERLGAVVLRGGRLDRGAIADAVFERADERAWLEELLWPRVGERVVEWRAHQERREPPPVAAIVEVPLLFEAEMEAVFDATIAVVAHEPRVMKTFAPVSTQSSPSLAARVASAAASEPQPGSVSA